MSDEFRRKRKLITLSNIEEPEKNAFQDIIDGDERCVLSAVNAHETACVLRGRHGVVAVAEYWQWLACGNSAANQPPRSRQLALGSPVAVYLTHGFRRNDSVSAGSVAALLAVTRRRPNQL